MTTWCKAHSIRQMFTQTHTPTSNGLVENFNLHLRRIMRDIFVRTNKLNWESHLDDILENRNNTKNTTITKAIPCKIWNSSREPELTEDEQKDVN